GVEPLGHAVFSADYVAIGWVAHTRRECADEPLRIGGACQRINGYFVLVRVESWPQQHRSRSRIVRRTYERRELQPGVILRRVMIEADSVIECQARSHPPVVLGEKFEVGEQVTALRPGCRFSVGVVIA